VFCGAGGLALGAASAGFKTAAVVDNYAPACATLRLNKKKRRSVAHRWRITEGDIQDVDFTRYDGKLDLLAGGPPCQPFSFGGKHEGRADTRNMFPEFIRAVRESSPRAFVIENVKGLTRTNFADYFDYLKLQLSFPNVTRKRGEKWKEHRSRLERVFTANKYKGLQYKVISQVVNATNYGIPQNRERVFIVGVRADLGIEYTFPLPTHTRDALIRQQWITKSYWQRHEIPKLWRRDLVEPAAATLERIESMSPAQLGKPWRTVRDALAGLPRVAIGRTSSKAHNHFLNDGAREYFRHSGSLLDWPAKTVKAGYHGVPGGENMLRLDDGRIRYFSVRECARLQTFPDSWQFHGSWTSCMRQLGNAVPVELGRIIVAPLYDQLRSIA
jgi:DNA (cytosine-5)-methyltransferase 1